MPQYSIGTLQAAATLTDEMSPQLATIAKGFEQYRATAGVALGAVSAFSLKAGNDFVAAQQMIAKGTGATGDALAGLTDSFRDLAGTIPGVASPEVATAIADLNTHMGLTGDQLELVAAAALKAEVDTNKFGVVAKGLGLSAAGATELLDQLTVASQNTGTDVDVMTNAIGRASARWMAAGGDMEGLTATVVQAAHEFGATGLRGAMSEILQEVDKGVIPSFQSLDAQLGDVSGAVVAAHEAAIPLSDRLVALKDRASALVGPYGEAAGAVSGLASGALFAVPHLGALKTALRGVVGVLSGPLGIAIAAGAATAAIAKLIDPVERLKRAGLGLEKTYATLAEKQIALTIADERAAKFMVESLGPSHTKLRAEVAFLSDEYARMVQAAQDATGALVEQEQAVAQLSGTFYDLTGGPMPDFLAQFREAPDPLFGTTVAVQELDQATRIAALTMENELQQALLVAEERVAAMGDQTYSSAIQMATSIESASTEMTTSLSRFSRDAVDIVSLGLDAAGQKGAAAFIRQISAAVNTAIGLIQKVLSLANSGVSIPVSGGGLGAAVAGAGALHGAAYGIGRLATGIIDQHASGRYDLESTQRRFPGAGQGGGPREPEQHIHIEIDGNEVAEIVRNRLPGNTEEAGW